MPQFQTLLEALQHWAQEKPDSAAFIFRDKNQQRNVLTWDCFYTLSGRFAAVLRGKGIGRGDLVISTLPNSPERVVCEAGIWLAGAASVNGQCLMADGSDLLNTITVSRAPAILVDPDVMDSPWNVLKNHVMIDNVDNVTSSLLPCLKKVIFVRRMENEDKGDFIGQLKAQEEWFQAEDVTAEDAFAVFTTSGTTGFSKLVTRTHGAFVKFLQSNNTYVEILINSELDFNISPMGWMGGSVAYNTVSGKPRVTCNTRAGIPDDMAQFIWTSIREEKCKTAFLSPIYFPELAMMVKDKKRKAEADSKISSPWMVNTIAVGGLPIHHCMIEKAFILADTVLAGYGVTDCGVVSASVITDCQSYVDYYSGQPFADVEVKIVSTEDESKSCAANQTGYILVKGPNMMKGYLNDPKATAEAFTENGFFRTGDLGRLDERGHLFVEGRGSDAIMKGLYVFYPSGIEQRIRDCPGIRDVVVVGLPDPYMNEELCACVILESDDVSVEQVREFVEETVVSKDDPMSPCPRYYLKFESFPVTHTGKPRRKIIKTQAAQRLGRLSKTD